MAAQARDGSIFVIRGSPAMKAASWTGMMAMALFSLISIAIARDSPALAIGYAALMIGGTVCFGIGAVRMGRFEMKVFPQGIETVEGVRVLWAKMDEVRLVRGLGYQGNQTKLIVDYRDSSGQRGRFEIPSWVERFKERAAFVARQVDADLTARATAHAPRPRPARAKEAGT